MTIRELVAETNGISVRDTCAMGHSEYYGKAIEALGGLDAVAECLPFSLEFLEKKYAEDPLLNNTPIRCWDEQAGFSVTVNRRTQAEVYTQKPFGLANPYAPYSYQAHGVTSFCCAEGVCILKEAARRLIERNVDAKSAATAVG